MNSERSDWDDARDIDLHATLGEPSSGPTATMRHSRETLPQGRPVISDTSETPVVVPLAKEPVTDFANIPASITPAPRVRPLENIPDAVAQFLAVTAMPENFNRLGLTPNLIRIAVRARLMMVAYYTYRVNDFSVTPTMPLMTRRYFDDLVNDVLDLKKLPNEIASALYPLYTAPPMVPAVPTAKRPNLNSFKKF